MKKWYTVSEVAEILGVARATVIGHCEDGNLLAVNIARTAATRKRWRISEEDLQAFIEQRRNKRPAEIVGSGRVIQRPKKDYFASLETGRPGARINNQG